MGYHQAGFEIVGVDINPQPHYPFEFVQSDALEIMQNLMSGGRIRMSISDYLLGDFDVIHASPPCQGYTLMNQKHPEKRATWPLLLDPVREMLQAAGRLYVIENVIGAPMVDAVMLCGSMFGLGVRRHRLFESNVLILRPKCAHYDQPDHAGVYGHHPDGGRTWTRKDGHAPLRRVGSLQEAQKRMGMEWGDWHGVKEAIPPAYTRYIGEQLIAALEVLAL